MLSTCIMWRVKTSYFHIFMGHHALQDLSLNITRSAAKQAGVHMPPVHSKDKPLDLARNLNTSPYLNPSLNHPEHHQFWRNQGCILIMTKQKLNKYQKYEMCKYVRLHYPPFSWFGRNYWKKYKKPWPNPILCKNLRYNLSLKS